MITTRGGANDYGVAFSFDISTGTYTKISDFTGANGRYPATSFVQPLCNTYFFDADKDGFGDAGNSKTSCADIPPQGYVTNSYDCNDNNNKVYAGAEELIDGIDNDCDGKVDESCSGNGITISINNKKIIEGNKGSKNLQFYVTLNKTLTQQVKVNYKTADETAVAGTDYTATNGTLTFAPGVKMQPITVTVTGDKVAEPDETFIIKLSNPVNAAIIQHEGTCTILDDDGAACSSAIMENDAIISEQERAIQLQPNPALNNVSVLLKGYRGNVTMQLRDAAGKVLMQDRLQITTLKAVQQSINVSGISNGTYFITVTDEKGNRQTEQLIISR
jgi:hypothetical protein